MELILFLSFKNGSIFRLNHCSPNEKLEEIINKWKKLDVPNLYLWIAKISVY